MNHENIYYIYIILENIFFLDIGKFYRRLKNRRLFEIRWGIFKQFLLSFPKNFVKLTSNDVYKINMYIFKNIYVFIKFYNIINCFLFTIF